MTLIKYFFWNWEALLCPDLQKKKKKEKRKKPVYLSKCYLILTVHFEISVAQPDNYSSTLTLNTYMYNIHINYFTHFSFLKAWLNMEREEKKESFCSTPSKALTYHPKVKVLQIKWCGKYFIISTEFDRKNIIQIFLNFFGWKNINFRSTLFVTILNIT